MKIRFKKTLDDFVAYQMFHREHTKKDNTVSNRIFNVFLLMLALGGIVFSLCSRNYRITGFFVLAIAVYTFFVIYSHVNLSTSFYKQAEYLQKEGMRELVGESVFFYDAESFYSELSDTQTKRSLAGIEKIVVCPDYVFIYTDPITAHYIPRRGMVEGDFDVFAAGLTGAYQAHAAGHGTKANVFQSDWVFRKDSHRKGLSFEEKVIKACDVILWAFIFGMVVMIISGLIFGFIMHTAYQKGWVEQAEDVPGYVVYIVFGIPLFFACIGAFLAFKGKLPKLRLPTFYS